MPTLVRHPDESGAAFLARYLTTVTDLVATARGGSTLGPPYACYEHLVLALGRPSTAQALPPLARLGEPKKCYANTLALVRTLPALQYVEGFAYHPGTQFVYPHAWAVGTDGRVWDRTWEDAADCAYWGIPFASSDLERFDALGEDYLGIIESQYLLGSPLLRTGRLFPPSVDTEDVHVTDTAQEAPDVAPRRP